MSGTFGLRCLPAFSRNFRPLFRRHRSEPLLSFGQSTGPLFFGQFPHMVGNVVSTPAKANGQFELPQPPEGVVNTM
jgi:hypothetical protein